MSELPAKRANRMSEELPLPAKRAKGPGERPVLEHTASLPGQPPAQPPPFRTYGSDPGPGFAETEVNMSLENAKLKLLEMSSELNELIDRKVREAAATAGEEGDFIGIIGGPVKAPISDAERAVALSVVGEGNVTPEVVGQARAVVASMIAGLIAYTNPEGFARTLDSAVDLAVAVPANVSAGVARASLTMLTGLFSTVSAASAAAFPVASFLFNPNVLALLPILFLGYSLSRRGDKDRLLSVLGRGKDAVVRQLKTTYNVSEDVANAIVTRAQSVVGELGENTISMIQTVSSVYLKLFATACAVVGSAQAAGQAFRGAPTAILDAFQSLRESVASGVGQARAGVGSFAARIRDATMTAARDVTQGDEYVARMGGRKTRNRVGRRHRGKRGASTRKGKGRGKAKRGGSTRKGKGKAKGKGRGSSTRRRHSRKH